MTDTERGDWGFELRNRLLLCDTRYEVQVAEGFWVHFGTQWAEIRYIGAIKRKIVICVL